MNFLGSMSNFIINILFCASNDVYGVTLNFLNEHIYYATLCTPSHL